eukprot:985376-Ditylum_brightwellii.AAC.1
MVEASFECVHSLSALSWIHLIVHDGQGKFCHPLVLGKEDCCFKGFNYNSKAVTVVLGGDIMGSMVGLFSGMA